MPSRLSRLSRCGEPVPDGAGMWRAEGVPGAIQVGDVFLASTPGAGGTGGGRLAHPDVHQHSQRLSGDEIEGVPHHPPGSGRAQPPDIDGGGMPLRARLVEELQLASHLLPFLLANMPSTYRQRTVDTDHTRAIKLQSTRCPGENPP